MSKLINKTRLERFATKLWDRIKNRYDNTLNGATLSDGARPEKKITFTRVNGTEEVVNLKDYTRLQDRNEFEKDVSVDNVGSINNLYIGDVNGNLSQNRILGHRDITSKAFVDRYVSDLVILANSDLPNGTETSWRIWAIKKGETNAQDEVLKIYHTANATKTMTVETMTLNGAEHKVVKLAINEKFTDEVYFMYQCTSHTIKVINPKGTHLNNNVVNLSKAPSNTVGEAVQWDTNNIHSNTGISYLYGRESIGSLAEKLRQTQADSSTYVKHSECTDGTDQGEKAGKVVKLDGQGKLDKTLLPKIAINEYYPVSAFNDTELARVKYENGDVVVVTTNGQVSKRYLCINKRDGAANSTDDFVELNSKDGVVTSLNSKRGDLSLVLESTETHVKLKVNGDGEAAETQLEVITTDEIDRMIAALPN